MDLEFRPRPIPTLLAALVTLSLLALGTWQLTRYFQKASVEDRRAMRAGEAPIAIDSVEAFDVPENEDRRVRVSGTLDTDRKAVFQYRNHNRRAGCWLASPLLLDGGGAVLANLGWIPATDGTNCDPSAAKTPDAKTWTGLVHVPARVLHDVRTRTSKDPDRPWGTFDVDGAYAKLNIEERPERPAVLVLAEKHSGDPYPVASTEMTEAPYLTSATHLSYAFTWYGLIMFVALLWAVVSARRVDAETTTSADGPGLSQPRQ